MSPAFACLISDAAPAAAAVPDTTADDIRRFIGESTGASYERSEEHTSELQSPR